MPAQLIKGLLKRSPLEATGNEKLARFDQILLRLRLSTALRRYIQRWAMRNVPATFLFQNAEKLELRFDLELHRLDAG